MTVPGNFNRWCSWAAVLFLAVFIGVKTVWYAHKGLPQSPDFPQYVMAGKIVRAGAWDSLYPVPRPMSRNNPGAVEDSTLRPRYAELSDQAGFPSSANRFIQPPPTALLFLPLAFVPTNVAYGAWLLLLVLATWGVGLQAAQMYTIIRGRSDWIAGILPLLICISPQAIRWVRVGNMSVLVGWVIGCVTLELARRDSVRAAVSFSLAALAKYAVLVLTPLYILVGRWRTLVWSAGVGIALVAVSLLVMGTEPYRVFARDIVPTLGRSMPMEENNSFSAFLMRISHAPDSDALPKEMKLLFRALQVVTLMGILGTMLVRRREIRTMPGNLSAAALALVSWLLVFSPIFWEHYQSYLAPFWGWLVAEAMRSRARMIGAISAIGLTYVPWTIIVRQLHFHQIPEPFYSHLLWATVLMGAMAVYSLLATRPAPAD